MHLEYSLLPSFETFLHVDLKVSRSRGSVYAIRSRFRRLVKWMEGKEFNRENLRLFLSELQTANAKPSYLNKFVALCKQLDKFLKTNTMEGFTYFHETYELKETLTPEEIKVMAEIEIPYKKERGLVNERQRALIMLLGTTGCRIGEALGLKWSDIGAEPQYVIFRQTKNGEQRVVPIGSEIYNLIYNLPHNVDYIFTSYRGGVLQHQELNTDFKKRAAAAGITKAIHAHIFRHSYITTMLESGIDSLDVAHLVGHRDPKSTMRYKNSVLSYYSGVAQQHPLLRQSLSIDQIADLIDTYLRKTVVTSSYNVTTQVNNDSLTFKIVRSSAPNQSVQAN